MKTIMEQMEEIQKLTDDMVQKASELNEATSKVVNNFGIQSEQIIDDQIKDILEEDNQE
jgi:hypothetical protein